MALAMEDLVETILGYIESKCFNFIIHRIFTSKSIYTKKQRMALFRQIANLQKMRHHFLRQYMDSINKGFTHG